MPVRFANVWLQSTARFLPGEPVGNDRIDDYIAPLDRQSQRIRQRILQENGIQSRHYAIDAEGRTTISHAAMAAAAVRQCLAGQPDAAPGLLAVGSSGGDALLPGFALSLQGELGLPPMQTLSSQGVCAAGVSAIEFAAQAIALGSHRQALAVAAEMPSRLFKRSRFAPRGYHADFEAQFLRWMLSDGAGALLLGDQPRPRSDGLAVQLEWIHQRSFAGDYPVCMQLGLAEDGRQSFLDYPSASAAEADGALSLRQDIRLLPHLFDIGIHEHLRLLRDGWIDTDAIDHFLCHYSSARFLPVIECLLDKAGARIPTERWYSNLATRGNTGAASIFVMLDEMLSTRALRPGQRILCFVPESGRFTVAFMMWRVVAVDAASTVSTSLVPASEPSPLSPAPLVPAERASAGDMAIAPPHDPAAAPATLRQLLTRLAGLWQDYRSSVWRTPLLRRIVSERLTVADYRHWAGQWVPQVREGSLWMREAAASLGPRLAPLAALIEHHAGDEQNDFHILYADYQAAGGEQPLDALRRNPGGDALNAFLHAMAACPDPIGLLGAIYIIEGTGQRIVPALLPLMRRQLTLPASAFRFLEYHGANDEHHLQRWLTAVEMALAVDGGHADAIFATAERTARLYQMQFDLILSEG